MPRGNPDIKLRKKFEKLRKLGKTYKEIQDILRVKISRSTMSYWAQTVKLPKFYESKIKELNRKSLFRAREKAFKANKLKHQEIINNLIRINQKLTSSLTKNSKRLILAMLYLGEGFKYKSHSGLVLGSSDSNIIKIFINILKDCYGIKTGSLKIRVSYRADQDISLLEKFWSKSTGVPLANFYKTIPDPRTIGKKTMNLDYKGVCVVHVLKSTRIQLELETISNLIAKNI